MFLAGTCGQDFVLALDGFRCLSNFSKQIRVVGSVAQEKDCQVLVPLGLEVGSGNTARMCMCVLFMDYRASAV